MSDGRTSGDLLQSGVNSRLAVRALLHPSILLLLAANSIPIWGVLYWGWDVFVLLILYWLETAIIGFWMILRIALLPDSVVGTMTVNGRERPASALFSAGFFVVHAGMFMGVHMVFLWSLFSGHWSEEIHGPSDFYRKLVIETDLWIPLLFLFLVRGFSFLFHVVKPEMIEEIERSLSLPISSVPEADNMGTIIGAFYGRVIVMHLTIIFSAIIAAFIGTIAPLFIMVAIKTVADVILQLKFEFGNLKKTSQTLSAVTSR